MSFKYTTFSQEGFTEVGEEFLIEDEIQEEDPASTQPVTPDHNTGKLLPFHVGQNIQDSLSDRTYLKNDEESSEVIPDVTDSLVIYFKSISRYPLLNEVEEKNIAIRIKQTEEILLGFIFQWNQLIKIDFMKSFPAIHMKKIRKNISQATGVFYLFDDFINLERKRKRLCRNEKKLTQGTAAQEEIKEAIYKVETALSKTIAQTSFSQIAVNVLIRQVNNISNGHKKTKRQQQLELELGKTLKKIRHYLDEIRAAKNELVQANLRIVISISKKYAYHGIPLSDLIQEGNLGLIRATDTYDYRRGYRFITYASWWIKQAVLRVIDCHSRTIRTPVYLREKINKITKASNQLEVERQREPTLFEIAERTNTTLETIKKVTQSFKESLSLDSLIEDNGEKEIHPPSIHTDNAIVKQVLSTDLAQRIDAGLSILSLRERHIIKLRFGIGESHNNSLEEIGKHFHLSRERIRQILVVSLIKLKNSRFKNELKDFAELNCQSTSAP